MKVNVFGKECDSLKKWQKWDHLGKNINHFSFPANKIPERNFGNKKRIYTLYWKSLDPKTFQWFLVNHSSTKLAVNQVPRPTSKSKWSSFGLNVNKDNIVVSLSIDNLFEFDK